MWTNNDQRKTFEIPQYVHCRHCELTRFALILSMILYIVELVLSPQQLIYKVIDNVKQQTICLIRN